MASGSLQAIRYQRGKLEVLDQLRLPHEFVYDKVTTCEEAFDCIKSMRVRGTFLGAASVRRASTHCPLGAPAIAIVAALALAVELYNKKDGARSSSTSPLPF